jgi:hypothetical protein
VVAGLVDAEVGDVGDQYPEVGGVLYRDVVDPDPITGHDDAARRNVKSPGRDYFPVRKDRINGGGQANELGLVTALCDCELCPRLREHLALGVQCGPGIICD